MGRTSIPCSGETRDELKQLKESQGKDWDTFLSDLAGETDATDNNSNELLQEVKETQRLIENVPEQTAKQFQRYL